MLLEVPINEVYKESRLLEYQAKAQETLKQEKLRLLDRLQNERLLNISHYYCEDSWYSCPLAEDGCSNEQWADDECSCNASGNIAKINQLRKELER